MPEQSFELPQPAPEESPEALSARYQAMPSNEIRLKVEEYDRAYRVLEAYSTQPDIDPGERESIALTLDYIAKRENELRSIYNARMEAQQTTLQIKPSENAISPGYRTSS